MGDDHARLTNDVTLARAAIAAACAMPGIAGVSPSHGVEVATYGPGETVRGVAVSRSSGKMGLSLHLIARYDSALALPALAEQVRGAVRDAVAALGEGPPGAIDVAFEDLHVEEGCPCIP